MGMAGMASSLFAIMRGVNVVQVGVTSEMLFATGLLDLMGTHPIEEQRSWSDPWAAIEMLTQDIPNHPYARLHKNDIQTAFEEIVSFLAGAGLSYHGRKGENCRVITPLGTIKHTYFVPQSMWSGVLALEEKPPCVIVDFEGLKEFSARQIVALLQKEWPGLDAARIPFPGSNRVKEFFPGEIAAESLESSKNKEMLISALKPLTKNAQAIGLPALLGLQRTGQILAELESRLGVAVFELPTLPISVPGLRLNETLRRRLSAEGVRYLAQNRVLEARRSPDGDFLLGIGRKEEQYTLRAEGVILASGRFWGRGLEASRQMIRETLFDLPVSQPQGRTNWHREDFLDSRGHSINRAGLEIDDFFRPLGKSGRPAYENLFAAGSILAHQDWIRMKCGSGLALATAKGAVNSFLKLNK
jgi:glycerol-3-phosphate dehydrogenase subunit B